MNRLVNRLPAEVQVPTGFVVLCLPTLVAAHQVAQVAEIYRLAAEQTQKQLAPQRPARVPAFSRN